jgi:hypothetical protein
MHLLTGADVSGADAVPSGNFNPKRALCVCHSENSRVLDLRCAFVLGIRLLTIYQITPEHGSLGMHGQTASLILVQSYQVFASSNDRNRYRKPIIWTDLDGHQPVVFRSPIRT